MDTDDITKTGEELIFNPFNSLNVEIGLSDIKALLKNYGVNYEIDLSLIHI